MPTNNRAIVTRLFEEAWKGRNERVLDELCAKDCAFYDPLGGQGPLNRQAYQELMGKFDRHFSVDGITIDETFDSGDAEFVLWHANVRMRQAEGGQSSGRQALMAGMAMIRLRDGKIVEHRSYWDRLAVFEQLGLIHGPAAAKDEGTRAHA